MAWKFTDSDIAILRRIAARERRQNPAIGGRETKQPRMLGGVSIKFGKANGDITPDTSTASVIEWETSVSPPVATTNQIDDITFDWISDETIADGKEIVWVEYVGGFKRTLWAECPDPPEANVAQIVEDAEIQSLPSFPLWGNLGSMTEAYRSGTSFGDHAGTSGLRVIEPGQYEVDFSFSATVDANNDSILLRSVTPNTTGAPLSYSARTAGDTISASFKLFATVTDADLAGGIVFILVEVSTDTNATVTWNHAEMSGKKISSNQDYTPGP